MKSNTKEGGSIKKNILVFAFFLLLSFIFWYLNSLGKDTETDIRYPVTYVNIPARKTLSAGLPSRLSVTLKGSGYTILKLKISGNSRPLAIDFSKISYRHVNGNKSADYYILAPALLQNFNQQLKSSCRIISVKPDTLYFSFR